MKKIIDRWRQARPYFWLHTRLYTLAYVLACFVNWKIYNPVQWVIDLPQQSNGERFVVLCVFFCWFIAVIAITQISRTLSQTKNKAHE